ncbi:glutamine synthetase family protein [Streptomyces clavuligerus]|uniref:glutamine synthetase n=1 Tax=Streptomyces clavuligerus TaxID=1901 RepID=B5GLS5_STRCL|nr:glutamine synthetase [Streptomyces clavuligerus]EDY47271.1 glutamine synthetase III [Streptomyces clavuligerus]EFG04934.1 glutamine synthetase III [Streptomyces clavuligerus]MBY6306631.1 glutamine synthetase [Streptomyces clavuligerus]QCS10763.1 glutamine synthetase [Streptomyces clavuligerus]QPJ97202.1 glutamine synthetase [Streptomyces clavuligerus]
MTARPASTTALDRHRERNSDRSAVDTVRERIAETGVEYVYYQSVTLSGRAVGKVVPAVHLLRNLEKGVQMHRSVVADFQTDRSGALLGGGARAAEFTALPDLDTFAVLPWDTTVGRFFCRLYEPAHLPERGGEPFAADARGNLIRRHREFTGRTGLVLRSGCEPEATWTGPGLEVPHRPDACPAYRIDLLERARPIYQKVITYGRALGLDMIEGDYEDPGQLELNWMYDRAELTADRLVTFRQICRQVARELGVTVSFMPKPAIGVMGNGCHHNLSLWNGTENVLAEPGRRELHLTETGQHALGGILAHAAGAMAVMGPTVNSYKRYWDTGLFAPERIDWGMDDKTCTVRLSANGRLEYKLPDAMVNPYLSHAVLLAVIADGLTNRTDPGPPQGTARELGHPFPALPLTLGEALTAFTEDTVVTSALTEEICSVFLAGRSDEWARFCAAVTDWEHQMYAEGTP